MAQRRVNEVAFNFDSLTDMVTNLAGGLILIVLLLTVLTRQKASLAGADAVKKARAAASASGKPPEVTRFKNEAEVLEREIPKLEAKVKEAQDEVAGLRREVDAKQPQEAADPKGKACTPSRVEFRPPMLKRANKNTGVAFVLTNNKVYYCVWNEYSEENNRENTAIRSKINNNDSIDLYVRGILKPLRTGDFDLHIKVFKESNKIYSISTAVMKLSAKGETLAEALNPGSDFKRLLGRFDPDAYFVDFDVFPDSFDLFRELRKQVMEKRFTYNWTPRPAGADLKWGVGSQGFTN